MMIILLYFTVAFLISLILMALMNILGQTSKSNREKLTPFECGFDPYKKSRSPFSLRFFLVTIMFLIFDVEIILLIPIGVITSFSNSSTLMIAAIVMTLILVIGLFHEWNQSSINWVT